MTTVEQLRELVLHATYEVDPDAVAVSILRVAAPSADRCVDAPACELRSALTQLDRRDRSAGRSPGVRQAKWSNPVSPSAPAPMKRAPGRPPRTHPIQLRSTAASASARRAGGRQTHSS